MKSTQLAIATLLAVTFYAPSRADELPADATAPKAAELKRYLDDRVFDVKLLDGTSWRLEFNSRGHHFVNISNGFNGQGNWRTEDAKLCSALRGEKESCNDVRLLADVLHLKRNNGQVIQLVPR